MKVYTVLPLLAAITLIGIGYVAQASQEDKWVAGRLDSECFSGSGGDYRGTVSQTKTGKSCQKWTAQSPHSHSVTPQNYENAGLGDHNYCRNPDNTGDGTWCYTTDSGTRWEACDVGSAMAFCGECETDPRGRSYRGFWSRTRTGKRCQYWTAQSPHSHTRTPQEYGWAGIGDHNYCRNPDNADWAWCYTTSSDTRWEYCDVGCTNPNPAPHFVGMV